MERWQKVYTFWLVITVAFVVFFIGSLILMKAARAHDHQPGETTEQQQVVDFLRTWRRPKGTFEIEHRRPLCCYADGQNQDCFLVAARRVVDGVLEVKPAFGELDAYDNWYKVNTKVNEDLQDDPRDSPDGKTYVCILGNSVVCYVEGTGT